MQTLGLCHLNLRSADLLPRPTRTFAAPATSPADIAPAAKPHEAQSSQMDSPAGGGVLENSRNPAAARATTAHAPHTPPARPIAAGTRLLRGMSPARHSAAARQPAAVPPYKSSRYTRPTIINMVFVASRDAIELRRIVLGIVSPVAGSARSNRLSARCRVAKNILEPTLDLIPYRCAK